MPNTPSRWEPYCHRPDAEFHLSKFASSVLGHDAGVIFFDGSGAARLKSARPDKDGDTTDLIVSAARPPMFPLEFGGQAEPLTIAQFARQHSDQALHGMDNLMMGAKSLYNRARAPAADFIESHKTAFDGANTVADVIGVISGGLSVAALFSGGVALAPLLGTVAFMGAAALLAADGAMFYFELRGNEVRKRRLANSRSYKMVEAIGPLLAAPDLLFNGIRTVRALPIATHEVAELTEAVGAAAQKLATQRDSISAYKEAHLSKLDRPNVAAKTQRMRAKANRLADDMRRAQQKLDEASRELRSLRTIELPGYAASAYGLGVYAIDPPDWDDTSKAMSQAWNSLGYSAAAMANHPAHHAARVLAPGQLAPPVAGTAPSLMQFHVGVSPGTGTPR